MSEQAQLKFSIEGLALEHVNTILSGLRELPAKVSIELIQYITQNAQRQIDAFSIANAEPAKANEPAAT